MSTGDNIQDLFDLVEELGMYVRAAEDDVSNYDVALPIISQIRSKLEHSMVLMPVTTQIIMNYLDGIEERMIHERR